MSRLMNLAAWLDRDRREPDKVLLYAQEIRHAASWVEAARNCLRDGDTAGALRCLDNARIA